MSEKIADVIKETENNKADRQEQYFFRTDQLTVGYDGKPLIREINIQLKKGEILTLIGPNGAGHYVKMVHNGIEYGDEELIDDSYNIMRNVLGLSVDEMADIFAEWNKGELDSYLVEITADILTRKDDLGEDKSKPIVDMILDRGANKGTGKWSSETALDGGAPQSVITEAVYARYISMLKDERVAASKVLPEDVEKPTVSEDQKKELVEKVREALYFGKVMSYAQGFEQMRIDSERYDWNLKFGELAQIWREGCIIRAQFLQKITDAFEKDGFFVCQQWMHLAWQRRRVFDTVLYNLIERGGILCHL